MSAATSDTKRSTKPFWLLVIVCVLLPLVPLPRRLDLARHHLWKTLTAPFPDAVKGSIEAHGATMGEFTSTIDTCVSGQRRQYFGISFWSYDHPEFAGHIALPEDGEPHVVLDAQVRDANGNEYAVPFYQHDCSTWDVDLHHTGSSHNRIRSIAGHARFDCSHSDTGAHVKGDLRFWSCH